MKDMLRPCELRVAKPAPKGARPRLLSSRSWPRGNSRLSGGQSGWGKVGLGLVRFHAAKAAQSSPTRSSTTHRT
eukprot:scaffold13177_cov70-Cyclotella_meneghiniana.AAC.2